MTMHHPAYVRPTDSRRANQKLEEYSKWIMALQQENDELRKQLREAKSDRR